MIDINGLTKTYGEFKAVDNFSFQVGPGEVVGLIGPNGAGKTSTLRCIVGIQAPSAGTIAVDGHDIVSRPSRRSGNWRSWPTSRSCSIT